MESLLQDLVEVLSLERLELNLFRGPSRDLGGRSMYGGQIIGQAMVAASHTVEGREPHSLHAYFLLPGDMTLPVVYEVDRLRDGKSFSSRRVQAIQYGRPILSMMASFHNDEPGFEHQVTMPEVPPPESLKPWHELAREWIDQEPNITDEARAALTANFFIEFRPIDPVNPLRPFKRDTRGAMWFRATARLPDDPWLHRCVLAYASDWGLLGAALRPYGRRWFERNMIVASIDHALWFHRQARSDEWLLYVTDSHAAQSARGLSRGMIFDTSGRLIASAAQEGLMRPVEARENWERSIAPASEPRA
ncbi:MAG: acyl-CoA thioesterase [Panacagrimonas sp.]